jgi:hypothetical protein
MILNLFQMDKADYFLISVKGAIAGDRAADLQRFFCIQLKGRLI